MNTNILLDHFARVSEAPDAVPRLRKFLLDLAVRGKLVEQDQSDEPASELIERIRAKKFEIAGVAGSRRTKASTSFVEEEEPYQIPNSWCWSRLAEVGFISPRQTAGDDVLASFVPMS